MLELCPSQGQLESKGHRGLEPRHAFSEISATSILAVWRNRSLASFLVRIRSDPKTVQTLLHHSDVKLTLQRYTHSISEDRMAAAVAMLTAIFSHAARQKRTESGLSERQFEFKSFTIIVARNQTGSRGKIAE